MQNFTSFFKGKHLYKTLFTALIATASLQGQIAQQGFEGHAQDTWNYSSNITPYTIANSGSSDDVWNVVSGQLIGNSQNSVVTSAHSGSFYFGGTDLDNSHALGILGGIDPIHILSFDPVAISNVSVDISFAMFFEGYDTADYIYFEVAYDNGTDWTTPDVHIEIDPATSGSNLGSNGGAGTWETFTHVVPAGHSHVRMRFILNQNGNNDFFGLDTITLDTHVLSTPNITPTFNFSLYPNPTQNDLYFSSNTKIASIDIYNQIGQRVAQQHFDALEGSLQVAHLTSGVYFTKVKSDQGESKSWKFIKN